MVQMVIHFILHKVQEMQILTHVNIDDETQEHNANRMKGRNNSNISIGCGRKEN